ncbi:protein YIPF3-like [Sycon ciliatum]|uniref:protein YIPF3-like n=1 Tax=Sycon ciliatum TaxID=27933 RepID=UPI0020AE04E4
MSTEIDLGDPAADGFGTANSGATDSRSGTDGDHLTQRIQGEVANQVAGQVWQAGKQSARRVFDVYGNVDFLRPYFDVEPWQVRRRLFWSLIPQRPTGDPQPLDTELYGPVMLVFTLVAILVYGMKSADHVVQEGTLMGTAIGISFLYFVGTASLFFFLAYLLNAQITLIQMLSLTGYGLFGPCVTLFLAIVIPSQTEKMFYSFWLVLCGLSALKMACAIVSRTYTRKQALALSAVVIVIHMLFVLYLHFSYAHLYQAISQPLAAGPVVPRPMAPHAAEHTRAAVTQATAALAKDVLHSKMSNKLQAKMMAKLAVQQQLVTRAMAAAHT